MNTHRNVVFTAQVYRDWMRAGRTASILGVAPLFHITGLIGHIAVSLLAPAPLVLAYRFEPQVVLDAHASSTGRRSPSARSPRSSRCCNAPGVQPGRTSSSFTSVYSGGAAISPTAEKAFLEATGKQVHNAYGLTETTSPMTVTPFGVAVAGRPDVGRAVGRACRRRARSSGSRTRTARTCRWARSARSSPTARRSSPGYWGKPEETAANLPGGALQDRRRRLHGPRGLGLHRRPQEGHDQRLRLQGVAARGGGRARRAPRGAGGRRGRRARTRSAARRSRRS